MILHFPTFARLFLKTLEDIEKFRYKNNKMEKFMQICITLDEK